MNNKMPGRSNIDNQLSYFKERRPIRLQVADTPYVQRHLAEVLGLSNLTSSHKVCEWGAGLGRFSRLLAPHVGQLTAVELSPALGAEFKDNLAEFSNVELVIDDALHAARNASGCFDRVVGFFVLHHLPDLEAYLAAARESLAPGGCCVFTEPNPYNPLYPIQITLTPGMSWEAEKGIYDLTPGNVNKAAKAAGFTSVEIIRYGILPRAIYNLADKAGLARVPEYITPPPLRAFQLIRLKA